MNSEKNFFLRLWQGNISLGITFWIFWAFGRSFFYVFIIESFGDFSGDHLSGTPTLNPLFLGLSLALEIFLTIAVWRSANNYEGNVIWAGLAKLVVIVAVVKGIAEIFGLTR